MLFFQSQHQTIFTVLLSISIAVVLVLFLVSGVFMPITQDSVIETSLKRPSFRSLQESSHKLCNVVQPSIFEAVGEILKCDHLIKDVRAKIF